MGAAVGVPGSGPRLVEEVRRRALAALAAIVERSEPGELLQLARRLLSEPRAVEDLAAGLCAAALLTMALEEGERPTAGALVEAARELLARSPETRRELEAALLEAARTLLSLLEGAGP